MESNLTVALAGGLLTLSGCATTPRQFVGAHPTGPVDSYVRLADTTAQRVLDEFNASPNAQQLGGPFSLAEYDRHAQEWSLEGRGMVLVSYDLRTDVTFLGHPVHFAIAVNRDTRETIVLGGR